MNTDIFPSSYEKQIVEETKAKKQAAEGRHKQAAWKIQTSNGEDHGVGVGVICTLLGIVVGFFACVAVTENGPDATDTQIWTNILSGFGTWLLIGLGMSFLGTILGGKTTDAHQKKVEAAKAVLEEEDRRYQRELGEIDAEAARNVAAYTAAFEKNAQTLSTRFAESRLAKDLIMQVSEKFISDIRSMPRRATDKQVVIPLAVKVYKNRISWKNGIYDFYEHRARNLNTPQEQTALAIAIISQVQLNAMMAMPMNASDVSPSVQIANSYAEDYTYNGAEECVTATITYTAVNRGYVTLQEW